MKAQTSIDPKLISLLGRKLYSGNPVLIATRELLQNSVDACKRANVPPDITISIKVQQKSTEDRDCVVTVVCDDNGCGMSEEELVNDFLCLGGTSKTGRGEVGGFGIAKAAIMAGSFWSVDTLSHHIDLNDVISGNDIGTIPEREGTRVTIQFDMDYFFLWYFEEICGIIYTSDVDIKFEFDTDTKHYRDDHAGLHHKLNTLVNYNDWTGYGIEAIDIDYITISSRSFVRLNGLTQFRYVSGGSSKRKSNILIDIHTQEDPSSKAYPLTMSREGLTGPVKDEIYFWIVDMDDNSASTDHIVQKASIPDNISFVSGRSLQGSRQANTNLYTDSLTGNCIDELINQWKFEVTTYTSTRVDVLDDYLDNSKTNSILKFVNYSPDEKNITRDSIVISLWQTILEMCMYNTSVFGVGFIGEDSVKAAFDHEGNFPFYLINPEYFDMLNLKDPKATVLSMWLTATHEMSHALVARHNEDFVLMMGYLQSTTMELILSNMDMLTKYAKNIPSKS